MSTRIQRLRILGEELLHEMRSLGSSVTSGAAIVFLDRLVRCEAFLPEEITEAKVGPLLEAAAAVRKEEEALLAEWAAAGLDLEGLLDRGYDLVEGAEDPGEIERWGWDLLLVANVAPYLPEPASDRAAAIIEDASILIEAHASAFAKLAAVASDRRDQERPERIHDSLGEELLQAFEEAPILASIDEGEAPAPPTKNLQEILSSLPPELVAKAGRAVQGAGGWVAEVVSIRTLARERAAASAVEPLRLAAESNADYGIGDRVLVRRTSAGEFVLSLEGSSLFLDFFGESAPSLSVTHEETTTKEAPAPLQGGWRWPLPNVEAPLRIEADVGPTKIEFVLPG